MNHNVLYFGCLGRAGHHLFDRKKGGLYYLSFSDFREYMKVIPWGYDIDGDIFEFSKDRYVAGHVHFAQKNNWSLVYWADYSVDSRPGSHSTFLVKATITREELIELAKTQWPEVFSRPRYPKLILK